jgi:acyl dehydratase
MRGVHATHHVVIHRPPRAGDTLATTARVAGVEARRAGVLVTMEMGTVDAAGQPVTTTAYGSVYRGAALAGTPAAPPPTGPDHPAAAPVARAAADPASPLWAEPVEVAATAAHVYTECARIWNPIHTDAAVARAAGLPGLILHGTATLALAVSRVLRREAGADPARVREVAGRFTGMVAMPSTFTVRVLGRAPDRILFDAVDAAGRPVLGEGVLCLSQR